jgi:hypothetical protein
MSLVFLWEKFEYNSMRTSKLLVTNYFLTVSKGFYTLGFYIR